MTKKESILFLCRDISYHQKKILDILLSYTKNIVILCSNYEEIPNKYKPYLHNSFLKLANASFTNWTLMFIAPILVLIDSIINKRTHVIGHYTLTFGWATSFAIGAKKTILTMGSDLLIQPFKNFIMKSIIKFSLSRANNCLVDNLEGYRNVIRFGFKGKLYFSPYGVEMPEKKSSIKEKVKQNGEIILWTRGTYPVYNINCFLEALEILNKKTHLKWTAIILGKGSNSKEFLQKINNLDFSEKIITKGYVTNFSKLKEIYQRSSIYVSSSISDGTSVALLEGMAFGLTIVVSDLVNNAFWIRKRSNGHLFDPNNPLELAKILEDIISQKISFDKRDEMIKNSQLIIKKYGTINTFANKMKAILSE